MHRNGKHKPASKAICPLLPALASRVTPTATFPGGQLLLQGVKVLLLRHSSSSSNFGYGPGSYLIIDGGILPSHSPGHVNTRTVQNGRL
jgi:hypothetical protein